ncbi:hypothetical protein L6452_35515 [Arctium lappa]|uniref:Uncharacterized protein n=1 Tax=Arctium lappa TaxID=4217 RepID=A0ACB8Y7C9_ARCLA|nr:hypothetical protein L6452_35515 [Arctium lappa]
MNDQEKKVYELSDKVWGKDEKAKLIKKDNEKKLQSHIKEKKRGALEMKKNDKNTTDLDLEYKRKHDKLMTEVAKMKGNDFPVDLAIELVSASKKIVVILKSIIDSHFEGQLETDIRNNDLAKARWVEAIKRFQLKTLLGR